MINGTCNYYVNSYYQNVDDATRFFIVETYDVSANELVEEVVYRMDHSLMYHSKLKNSKLHCIDGPASKINQPFQPCDATEDHWYINGTNVTKQIQKLKEEGLLVLPLTKEQQIILLLGT